MKLYEKIIDGNSTANPLNKLLPSSYRGWTVVDDY